MTVVIWWIYSSTSASYAFPPLSEIMTRFRELWLFDRFISDVIPSLGRFAVGLAGGATAGLLLGVWLGASRNARETFDPVIQFVRSLPPPALLPVFLLVFGLGDPMKIFIIAFGSIWPVLLNTVEGIRGIDPTLRATCDVYKISPLKRLTSVTLPAAANSIFAGLKTALGIAFVLMVVSEMVAASGGIGHFVVESQHSYAIADMWSGIILLGMLGFLFNVLFDQVQKRAVYWPA
ncbi:ABC transporter permease [Pseudarthrobacter sp. H2]|uniref:ABC transporter permease n=1 Tax=Pseudarthrobacter sp. H2 TaxID=3418415 RepID=UPI003CF3D6E8